MKHYYTHTLADDILSTKHNSLIGDAVKYNIQEAWNVYESMDEGMSPQKPLHPKMWMEFECTKVRLGLFLNECGDSVHYAVFRETSPVTAGAYSCKDCTLLANYRSTRVLFNGQMETVDEEWSKGIESWVCSTSMYAIMLLNCKNITTINKEPPTTINERRAREKKTPYTSYKILKLPVGKTTRYIAPGSEHQGNHNRWHIARGHFKTYTSEKPLLGKVTGTFWWPQVCKGNKENGQVIKDYALGKVHGETP